MSEDSIKYTNLLYERLDRRLTSLEQRPTAFAFMKEIDERVKVLEQKRDNSEGDGNMSIVERVQRLESKVNTLFDLFVNQLDKTECDKPTCTTCTCGVLNGNLLCPVHAAPKQEEKSLEEKMQDLYPETLTWAEANGCSRVSTAHFKEKFEKAKKEIMNEHDCRLMPVIWWQEQLFGKEQG